MYEKARKTKELQEEKPKTTFMESYEWVREKVECRRCGKCCEEIGITIGYALHEDIRRWAKEKRIDVLKHLSGWAIYRKPLLDVSCWEIEDFDLWFDPETGEHLSECPFLSGNRCKIHGTKPFFCRRFPLTPPNLCESCWFNLSRYLGENGMLPEDFEELGLMERNKMVWNKLIELGECPKCGEPLVPMMFPHWSVDNCPAVRDYLNGSGGQKAGRSREATLNLARLKRIGPTARS